MLKLAVFGNPIEHSLSPIIHAEFARQTNIAVSYVKILADKNGFQRAAQTFIDEGASGFNITVPFKLDAFEFATELTLNAKMAGAVNTIKVQNNRFIGENTDGIGLLRDLTHNLKLDLNQKTILILGAGGAAQGILLPLLKQNPKRIMIANRSENKAKKLQKDFSTYGKVCGFALDKIKNEPVDILINATSASLDNTMPTIATGCADGAVCYDLMYAQQTPFMRWAKQNNASMVVDGLGMLVEQAACSFEFWTGKQVNTQRIMRQLKT
jgi:shikimate dehydrogenase